VFKRLSPKYPGRNPKDAKPEASQHTNRFTGMPGERVHTAGDWLPTRVSDNTGMWSARKTLHANTFRHKYISEKKTNNRYLVLVSGLPVAFPLLPAELYRAVRSFIVP
jgi:hypothetical protein